MKKNRLLFTTAAVVLLFLVISLMYSLMENSQDYPNDVEPLFRIADVEERVVGETPAQPPCGECKG